MLKKKIESYQNLLVWQKSIDLVAEVYRIAGKLPANEQYGLTSQLRRAAVSVPANIAEGFGRWHSAEFVRFLLIADGSLKEVETHLFIGNRLALLSPADTGVALQMSSEISKMISLTARQTIVPKVNKRTGSERLEHCNRPIALTYG